MLRGFSLPRTPAGTSCLVPSPPWHFAGNVLAVEYKADPEAVTGLLPDRLTLRSPHCCVYFIEWQYASDTGEEHLDPVRSQYRETLFLLSADYRGEAVAYCPFIWVDQDISLMRGVIQGWPKQLGSTWMTRAFALPSKAAAAEGPGGRFGASLSVRERRVAEACITLRDRSETLPSPDFSRAVNVRWFPNLQQGRHETPLVNDLVQLKSRDVAVSPIWRGDAALTLYDHPHSEVGLLKPVAVTAGYRFSVTLTVDDLMQLT